MDSKKRIREIKINLNKITKQEFGLIVDYLRQGKVIVCPTDTIYGIGCLATDEKAIRKIYKIKKRNKKKPLLILASSFRMVRKYCFLSKAQENFLKNKCLCPVSVILKSRNLLPKELTGGKDSIAIRLPQNNFLIKIIRRAGAPIVSTSLNISGRENIENIDNLEKYFKDSRPDLLINAGKLKGKPSKLIDLRDINNIKILRK